MRRLFVPALTAVLHVGAPMGAAPAAAEPQPNILYVLTDDQRYDSIRAFNKMTRGSGDSALGYVESPRVDRLAAMGTTFINTYVHATGCAPSRASIHLGRYPHRSGIYQFEYHNSNAEHFQTTLPEAMRELGYETLHIGKLGVRLRKLVGDKSQPHEMYDQRITSRALAADGLADWSKGTVRRLEGKKLPEALKGDWFFAPGSGESFELAAPGLEKVPGYEDANASIDARYDLLRRYGPDEPRVPGVGSIIAGVSPQPAGETRDGYYVQALDKFLSHAGEPFAMGSQTYQGPDAQRPLFAHLGFDFPHTPVLPPKSFRDRFAQHIYAVPEVDPAEFDKLPTQFQKLIQKNHSDHYTDAQKQRMISDYFAFCAYGDQLVGEAVDRFMAYSEDHGRPWMVVYVCGDHGWKLNDHGTISKFTPWNIDSQNPIVVVASDKDRFPAGKVVTDFTEFVDIMPTVLSAGGADLADDRFGFLDGYDLAGVVSGQLPARDYVLGESHHVIGPRASIRTKDFMYSIKTRPNSKRGAKPGWTLTASDPELEPVLYDLEADPGELNNVAHDPSYAQVAQAMKKKLIDIVIGDGRVEVDWAKSQKLYTFDVFAPGADDKRLSLPR